jgi:hypothetical protein
MAIERTREGFLDGEDLCCVCDEQVKVSTMNVCEAHEKLLTVLVRQKGMSPAEGLYELIAIERGT